MRKIALTLLVMVSATAAVVAVHKAVRKPPFPAVVPGRTATQTVQLIDRQLNSDHPYTSIDQLHTNPSLLHRAAPRAAPQILYPNARPPANCTDNKCPLY